MWREGCRIGDDVVADVEGMRATGPGRGGVRLGEELLRVPDSGQCKVKVGQD